METKQFIKEDFPDGTVIKGGWGNSGSEYRTIYNAYIDGEMLHWGQKENNSTTPHAWKLSDLTIVLPKIEEPYSIY